MWMYNDVINNSIFMISLMMVLSLHSPNRESIKILARALSLRITYYPLCHSDVSWTSSTITSTVTIRTFKCNLPLEWNMKREKTFLYAVATRLWVENCLVIFFNEVKQSIYKDIIEWYISIFTTKYNIQ